MPVNNLFGVRFQLVDAVPNQKRQGATFEILLSVGPEQRLFTNRTRDALAIARRRDPQAKRYLYRVILTVDRASAQWILADLQVAADPYPDAGSV